MQEPAGINYNTVQKQRTASGDQSFTLSLKIKGDRKKDEPPKFRGDFVQGPTGNKFVYIDIGACAGQEDSPWSRRLKIPLAGIRWKNIDQLTATPNSFLETSIPGTGKDGGPDCATVKPFGGWHLMAK